MLSLGLFYLSLGIYCLFMWLRKWIFMIGFPVLAFISLCLCCKVKRIALSWMTEHCDFLLQTVDVFAIVALSGILSRLLSTGTVLVATSNRAPSDLNQVCLKQNLPDRIDLLKASIHNFVPFWWFYLDSATPFGFLVLFFSGRNAKRDISTVSGQTGPALWKYSSWKWNWLSSSYSKKFNWSGKNL